LKQNKPWFDEECLGFLNQRKWVKMQWMQDPSQSNVDIRNNVRREVSRHFRNKKKACLIAKIEELETNCKIQNVRDLYTGIIAVLLGSCHHGMARPPVADRRTASDKEGSCE